MVSSRLFPPGTIYASALTPVIVAAVSEMLNRPADAVSELRKQRRMMALEARALETARVRGDQPSPLRGAPDFAQGPEAEREFAANGNAQAPPIRIHGRRKLPRRILHPKVWIVTGLAAFAIAAAVLTLPELLFGGAVATSSRTTFFGGGSSSSSSKQDTGTTTTPTGSKTQTQTQTTATQTTPSQSPTQQQTTPTATDTTPTDTGTSTNPSGGISPQSSTGTSTTPTPGGVDTPPSGN
jgi:cell division septation protein DedD